MTNWIRDRLGLTLDEAGFAIALVSLLTTILLALVKPLRAIPRTLLERLLIGSGATKQKYARWFIREHGKLRNIYLNRIETLDLSDTFVPLNVADLDAHGRVATDVLNDVNEREIIVVGVPGSGKSTLLKAMASGYYGAMSQRYAERLESR
jgi:hypothetical protein